MIDFDIDNMLTAEELEELGRYSGKVVCKEFFLTPFDGAIILEKLSYEKNRPVSAMSVSKLTKRINDGEFHTRPTDIHLVVVKSLGNRVVLMNGHHRMKALSHALTGINALFIFQSVFDMEDADRNYRTHDEDIRKRNPADGVKNYLKEKFGCSAKFSKNVALALSMIDHKFYQNSDDYWMKYTTSSTRLLELAKEYSEEISGFWRLVRSKQVNDLHRDKVSAGPVVAVALVTLRKNRERAVRFWNSVVTRVGQADGWAEKALADWLDADSIVKLMRKVGKEDARGQRNFYVSLAAFLAWDKHSNDKMLSLNTLHNNVKKMVVSNTMESDIIKKYL